MGARDGRVDSCEMLYNTTWKTNYAQKMMTNRINYLWDRGMRVGIEVAYVVARIATCRVVARITTTGTNRWCRSHRMMANH